MSLIEKLKEYELISINEDQSITVSDTVKVGILRDLHENDVISFWKYPKVFRDTIIELVDKGLVYQNRKLHI